MFDETKEASKFDGLSVQHWCLSREKTPKRIYWAIQVIKMYKQGERHGYVPQYPAEPVSGLRFML